MPSGTPAEVGQAAVGQPLQQRQRHGVGVHVERLVPDAVTGAAARGSGRRARSGLRSLDLLGPPPGLHAARPLPATVSAPPRGDHHLSLAGTRGSGRGLCREAVQISDGSGGGPIELVPDAPLRLRLGARGRGQQRRRRGRPCGVRRRGLRADRRGAQGVREPGHRGVLPARPARGPDQPLRPCGRLRPRRLPQEARTARAPRKRKGRWQK